MKIKNIGIIVAATLVFASCGTNKAIVKQSTTVKQTTAPTQSSVQKQKLQFVQKVSDQSLYQKNLVSDLSFTLNTGSRNISVPGILHMRRDEVIRIQLLIPLIRSEVGRIEFTKDYVLFIDRMHKQYVKASYNDVAFLKDNGINFYSLQALFWNQLFIPGQQRVGESQLSMFSVDLAAVQANNVPVTLLDGKMAYKWLAESVSGLINMAEAKYTSANHGVSTLKWNYGNFQNFGAKKFPVYHEVTIQTQATKQQRTIKAVFELNGLSDNADWESFTTPSSRYQKVGVDEILEKLTKL
ncbi:DUF4292 domain-containing protein [Prevotella corporis]|uniref:DUF4292 domain-containing protein n=1 Tax=Prevotella corporis TaxID=28128 RepID=UPI0004275387|nr:DUF4292 domain-containing protein [Prevotella corporis]MDQ7737307.1 DUF4292 domain-containing protein [Prevotella corporis]